MANGTSNVILIDPNEVNINNDMVNGIPQYQDMYIFAELVAKSKGRTIIINGNTNSTDSKTINFIGNNQSDDDNDPNKLNFTTNYYDGSVGNNIHYEGFGISSIDIKINSSYVPQVNIQFVDVRGLAFFNQNDSPYRILFDFPPPVFELTVKGYYGKPLKYKLHLVKYTSEFSSDNGNFNVDAQFVAVTFAPLADILFRYVVNTPLIPNNDTLESTTNNVPKSTYELILKLKNLYTAINDKLETDSENNEYVNVLKSLENIGDIEFMLKNYKDSEILNGIGTPYLVSRNPQSGKYVLNDPDDADYKNNDTMKLVQTLDDYNKIIESETSSGVKNKINNRLYIIYKLGVDTAPFPILGPVTEESTTFFESASQNYPTYYNALTKYKTSLLNQKIKSINFHDTDIIEPDYFFSDVDIVKGTVGGNHKYYGMDISDYYYKLHKNNVKLDEQAEELSFNVTTKINNMIENRLGMLPSIYNIFKIILDDVDKFFSIVKKTSTEAFNVHNNPESNKKLIIGDGSYADKKDMDVYSFPLVINSSQNNREERVAPLALAEKVSFPEIDLVMNFMDTFITQKNLGEQYSLRELQNDSGAYDWIPICPIDSVLGGANPISPYLYINDDVTGEILNTLIKRFYVLTQGTIPDAFYGTSSNNEKENILVSSTYSTLYSEAEAINLNLTLLSEKNSDNVREMVEKYKNNISQFYDDIKGNPLYNFATNSIEEFPITPSTPNEGNVYVNKNNSNFIGVILHDDNIEIKEDGDTGNPVDDFSSNAESSGWFSYDPAEKFFQFTKDNLLYIKDWNEFLSDKNNVDEGGGEVSLYTRYLSTVNYYTPPNQTNNVEKRNSFYPGKGNDDIERQLVAYNEGNTGFTYSRSSSKEKLNMGNLITRVWSEALGNFGGELVDTLTGDTNMASMLILSNFSCTVSPFNEYPNGLNKTIFDTPAAIEVPAYYAPYIGMLLTAISDGWESDIVDFFTGGTGLKLYNRGFFILADLHDVKLYLSEEDERTFINAYDNYLENDLDGVMDGIKELFDKVNKNINETTFNYYLNPKSDDVKKLKGKGTYYPLVLFPNITRSNFINLSQITFKMSETYDIGYTSLETLNNNTAKKQANDDYFINLFSKVSTKIKSTKKEKKQEKEQLKKAQGDTDIINQLYYSFKNINDKWISGTAAGVGNYPFNGGKSSLIDLFAFVDRGMNPIGETMINCEILIDLFDDPNVSLFTVLSQLLSLNGFEFFPLQNFIKIGGVNDWEDDFKIHTNSLDTGIGTFFVCMYIGGSSSYPSVSGNGFENDGIINIDDPQVSGFSPVVDNELYDENKLQEQKNNDFSWRKVRAFRVRFGEQNQSMFKNIKIDSKEYPETNESIQILSRLAGDNNPDAPVPKGQNLYNLYENRSYKATVTGMGNAMIQPTQYFQLENIPLFNGAYIILDVEHKITPNKMTTSFSGTKLLKYPIPRVLNPVAFTNYEHLNYTSRRSSLAAAPQAINMSPERIGNNESNGGLDSVYGVDVSHWNGNSNWVKVKAAGVDFAVMKLTEGKTLDDGQYKNYNLKQNISNAIAAGIDLTFYHFARFGRTVNPTQDAIDDATNFINNLNKYSPTKPKLPVVLDVEMDGFSKKTGVYKWKGRKAPNIEKYILKFIEMMEDEGYKVMIYAGNDFITKFKLDYLGKYPLWLARYFIINENPSRGKNPERDEPPVPSGWVDWTGWQFSSQGQVDGIQGRVDINVFKKSYVNP